MKYQKGDTLIEVTLAIGVFSMIAIAVVAVMNSGTSGAQSSLETTLAREEIDAQAEALRFIQSSYINDKGAINADENRFQKLWQEITNLAVDPDLKVDADGDGVKDDDIAKFTPNTCQALYNNNYLDDSNAFIINTRYLGDFTTANTASVKNSSNGDSAIFIKKEEKSFFQPASTYPRLIFRSNSGDNNSGDNNSGDNNLIDSVSSTASKRLYRAEGIFIVAVKDADKTTIVGDAGAIDKKSAFYDFYIRSCWYSSGTNTPSTISTVIRLYDPDAVAERDGEIISFSSNGGKGTMPSIFVQAGKTKALPANTFKWRNVDKSLYSFLGWSTKKDGTVTYKDGATYKASPSTFSRKSVTLYAVWDVKKFNVNITPTVDDGSDLSEYYTASAQINGSEGDVSQPMMFGSTVKIAFTIKDDYPYSFQDRDNICQGIKGCTITANSDKNLAISFTANYAKTASDAPVGQSSGVYRFNVRPAITKNP